MTMGAAASKNASSSSPYISHSSAASASEVSGPVAKMMAPASSESSRKERTSLRTTVMSGCSSIARVTASENRSRSTASAPPAGMLVAHAMR